MTPAKTVTSVKAALSACTTLEAAQILQRHNAHDIMGLGLIMINLLRSLESGEEFSTKARMQFKQPKLLTRK